MKVLSLIFLVSLGLSPLAGAQSTEDGVIKATVTMLGDGRQKNMVVDPEKKTAEETILDQKGKLLSRTVYGLDERNLPRGATYYDAKGKELYKSSYKRDAADRIQEETFLSAAGRTLSRRVYTYGANNKVTQMDTYDGNGVLIPPAPKPVGPGRPDKKRR